MFHWKPANLIGSLVVFYSLKNTQKGFVLQSLGAQSRYFELFWPVQKYLYSEGNSKIIVYYERKIPKR